MPGIEGLFSIAMARLPEFHQGPLGDDAHVAKLFLPLWEQRAGLSRVGQTGLLAPHRLPPHHAWVQGLRATGASRRPFGMSDHEAERRSPPGAVHPVLLKGAGQCTDDCG